MTQRLLTNTDIDIGMAHIINPGISSEYGNLTIAKCGNCKANDLFGKLWSRMGLLSVDYHENVTGY